MVATHTNFKAWVYRPGWSSTVVRCCGLSKPGAFLVVDIQVERLICGGPQVGSWWSIVLKWMCSRGQQALGWFGSAARAPPRIRWRPRNDLRAAPGGERPGACVRTPTKPWGGSVRRTRTTPNQVAPEKRSVGRTWREQARGRVSTPHQALASIGSHPPTMRRRWFLHGSRKAFACG